MQARHFKLSPCLRRDERSGGGERESRRGLPFLLHHSVTNHALLIHSYFISISSKGNALWGVLFCIYMQCPKTGRQKTGSACAHVLPTVCTRSAEFLQTLCYRLCTRPIDGVHTDRKGCDLKRAICIFIQSDCINMQNWPRENRVYGRKFSFERK